MKWCLSHVRQKSHTFYDIDRIVQVPNVRLGEMWKYSGGRTRCEIMALTIGTKLGSHEITALLGKGRMGEVYRARNLKLKREVAIKILPEEFTVHPNLRWLAQYSGQG